MNNYLFYRKKMYNYPFIIILNNDIVKLIDNSYTYKYNNYYDTINDNTLTYFNFIINIINTTISFIENKNYNIYISNLKNLYYTYYNVYDINDKYINIIFNFMLNKIINIKYDVNYLKKLHNVIDDIINNLIYDINLEDDMKIFKKINKYNTYIDILLKIITCKNKYFIVNKLSKSFYKYIELLKYNNFFTFNTIDDLNNFKINDNFFLTINNKKINKINGPNNMYILKPKKQYYKYKLPLLLLFGDIHTSKDKQCNKCDIDKCYNIQNTLLELINDIKLENRNDKKINFTYDLYVEKKNYQKYVEEQDIFEDFLADLRRNYCFTNKNLCKYKNINWHYVDLRQFKNIKSNDDKTKNDIYKILPDIFNNLKYNKKLFTDIKQFTKFIDDINYINKYFYVYILYINNISLKNINYNEVITLLQNFKYNNNTTYILLPNYDLYKHNDVYIYIFYFLDNYNIYKQLLKIDNNLKKELIISIIKYIKKNLDYNIKYLYKNTNDNIKYITKIIHITNNINYQDYNNIILINKIKKNINKIDFSNFDDFIFNIILFNSILLDIYYILRCFKISYNKNGDKYKSLLSIGYFGASHTKKLYNFFISNYYDTLYKNNYNQYNKKNIRCIKIDKNINLDINLNDLYEEYNNNIDIITKYDEQ